MTDGWNWRQPDGATTQANMPQSGGPSVPAPAAPNGAANPVPTAWWSDALRDPWRDPRDPGRGGGAGARRPATPHRSRSPTRTRPAGSGWRRCCWSRCSPRCWPVRSAARWVSPSRPAAVRARQTIARRVRQPRPRRWPSARPTRWPGSPNGWLPSVVTIRVNGQGGISVGSGFVASADGYVITNDHVVEASRRRRGEGDVQRRRPPRRRRWSGRDPESDIAVIKVARTGLTPGASSATRTRSRSAIRCWLSARRWRWRTRLPRASSARSTGPSGGRAGRPTPLLRGDPDRRRGQPGQLGRPAGRRRRPGDRRQLGDQVARGRPTRRAGNIGLAFAIPINQAKRVTRRSSTPARPAGP